MGSLIQFSFIHVALFNGGHYHRTALQKIFSATGLLRGISCE